MRERGNINETKGILMSRRKEMDSLTPFLSIRERNVIALAVGEPFQQGMIPQDIAKKLGLSVEEVIDIQACASKKLSDHNRR